jgi:hypothetical protein
MKQKISRNKYLNAFNISGGKMVELGFWWTPIELGVAFAVSLYILDREKINRKVKTEFYGVVDPLKRYLLPERHSRTIGTSSNCYVHTR